MGLLCPFREISCAPCYTIWPGPRSISIPSGILIHPAVLATTDMGRKVGAAVPFLREAGTPCNTMWPGPRPTPVPSGILMHAAVATIHGPKLGVLCPLVFWGRAGSPSNTMSPGPRSTSVPSGILIHPAVWPQQTWAENWGTVPFWGGQLGPHLTQCDRGWGYLGAKFHLDPFKCLARIHQRHRQDGCFTNGRPKINIIYHLTSFIGGQTGVLEVGRYGTLYQVYPYIVCTHISVTHSMMQTIMVCQHIKYNQRIGGQHE